MLVNRFQNTGQHQKELNIVMRGFAWVQQVNAIVCGDGPVVVLTGTIYPCKRLLMKETGHSVAAGHFLQSFHHKLIVIHCNIGFRINRRQFVLGRGHLVMLCLGADSQLPQFFIHIFHICCNPFPNGSEIVIIHFLALGGHCAEQGTSSKNQIFPL